MVFMLYDDHEFQVALRKFVKLKYFAPKAMSDNDKMINNYDILYLIVFLVCTENSHFDLLKSIQNSCFVLCLV